MMVKPTLVILDGLIPDHPRILNELKGLKGELEKTFQNEVEAISTQVLAVYDTI
jgi:hypothetical protein